MTKAAEKAILEAADGMKAEARRMSRETSLGVNRHLPAGKRRKDSELEVEVDKWFDKLDVTSLDVVQVTFPGKELLKETLKLLNDNQKQAITRGGLVAALDSEHVSTDVKDLLIEVAGGQNKGIST